MNYKTLMRRAGAAGLFLSLMLAQMPAAGQADDNCAIRIDGQSYSVADVNYFFYTVYNNFCTQNEAYLSYMLDTSVPLKEQTYDGDVTWFDFFLEDTISSMTSALHLANKAREQGVKLPADTKKQLQEYMHRIEALAETSGVTPDTYVAMVYGEDMSFERYKALTEASYLASFYTAQLKDSYTYSEEELTAYYEDNSSTFDHVSYERLFFKACERGELPTPERMDETRRIAGEAEQLLAEGTSMKEIAEQYPDAVYFATEDAYYSEGYAYGDWLFDDDRVNGDHAVIDGGNGCYLMQFHEKIHDTYSTVDLLDLYFPVDPSDTVHSMDEQFERACTYAETFMGLWEKESEKDAETFLKLARTMEENANAQIHTFEEANKNTIGNASLEKWCFADGRTEGEAKILYSEDGFHTAYLSGFGREAWIKEAEDALREADAQKALDEILSDVKVERSEELLDTVF